MKKYAKEIKIGICGVVALCLLYFGINFLKGKSLFSSTKVYYIAFHDAKGLTKSSDVYADGFKIGIVSDVTYDYQRPGNVIVEIEVGDDVIIPRQSQAKLSEGMLGGCTLNMYLSGNPKDHFSPGDTIQGTDGGGLMDELASVMPRVDQVLQSVDTLVCTLNRVAGDPNIQQTLQNAATLTAELSTTADNLNKLLTKDLPKLTATFDETGKKAGNMVDNLAQIDLQKTLDEVNGTLQQLQELTNQINSKEGTLGLLMNDTTLYSKLNTTVQSATNLLQDLKENPKRYVHFSLIGKK